MYFIDVAGALFGWIGDILSTFNDVLFGVFEALLKMLETLITKTPYPKDGSGDPKFLGKPSGDVWGPMYDLYQTSSDLTLVLLMILLVVVAGVKIYDDILPDYAAKNDTGKIVKMMFATVLWWPIGVAMLVLSDLLAQAVLTMSSTEEGKTGLVAAVENIRDNAISGGEAASGVQGIVMSLALLIPFVFKTVLMLILIFLWIIRYLFIFLLMPVMPLVFALLAFDMPGAESLKNIGQTTIETYISLIFLTFPAAVVVVVFGQMSGKILTAIDNVIAGGDTATATMVLADGAAATGDLAGIISSITTLIIGIAFMAALPLIAAGGPFILMWGGDERLQSVAMNSVTGGVAGSVLNTGKSAGSFANELAADPQTSDDEKQSSGGGGDGTTSGSTDSQSDPETETETTQSSSSRFGRMKQKMSSGINRANSIKESVHEWDDKSAAEKTKSIAGGAASAGESVSSVGQTASNLLQDKYSGAKSEVGTMRDVGITDYGKLKGVNAKNKTGNALTKGKVGTGDGYNNLKKKFGDMGHEVDKNFQKARGRVGGARRKAGEVREEGIGSTIKSKFHTADWENMSEHEKREKLREVGQLDEYKNSPDKSAKEVYMNAMKQERETAQDIHEDRVKSKKQQRDAKKEELEQSMKALGVWEDYQNSNKSASEILRSEVASGSSVKASDLPPSVAAEVGLNPEDARESDIASGKQTTTRKRKQTTEEYFASGQTEFDSEEELRNAVENGEQINGEYYDKESVEGDDAINDFVRENLVGEVTEQETTTNWEEGDDWETAEEYRENADFHEMRRAVKENGYTNEDGEVTENEIQNFLDEVIAPKAEKRSQQSKSAKQGEVKDGMSLLLDDAESTDSVSSGALAETVADTERELDKANHDLSREGQKVDSEELSSMGMSEEDIDALQDNRPEDVSEQGRENLKRNVMPDSSDRDFTDVPEDEAEDRAAAINQVLE